VYRSNDVFTRKQHQELYHVTMQVTDVNSTCKVFEMRAFVFESIRGPLTRPEDDLPSVPRDRPRSSWYASSSICSNTHNVKC